MERGEFIYDVEDRARNQFARNGIVRTLDVDGTRWLVYARELPFGDGRQEALVFDSSRILRVVREYPSDWFRREDMELHRLLGSR